MPCGTPEHRWRTDGKFFRCGDMRVFVRAVTYGPFPGGWPESFAGEFSRITGAGFNAIRLYEMPEKALLDAAQDAGLRVFGGLKWSQSADFLQQPGLYSAARVGLAGSLESIGEHPALAGVYVGNEVPADLVRWMGPLAVRRAIEELISLGRGIAPGLLFAYANYPSTEYLEPENADFTAFNVYLESESRFREYLGRLHHIAGDRPLVISEFGLDSRRNGLERQAESLQWAVRAAADLETAGMTIYAWSDRWWNAGAEVHDWDFGLVDRSGLPKPALAAVNEPMPSADDSGLPEVSVIVCTRNGRHRIGDCLEAIASLDGSGIETLVVDDGSDDGTAAFVRENFPSVRLLELEPGGLSAARNAGAEAARGEILAFTDDDCEPDHEWIVRLRPVFRTGTFAAAGGPNLPPPPRDGEEAAVGAAPGAPSHVMLDDHEAEHLPGCNLAVTRAAFNAIGGFDPQFHTAGDDVDFCWRLRDAGFRLGFAPGAFVWHRRRPSIRAFLRQQLGYGKAERRLLGKHRHRFSRKGDAIWQGFVYGGGPVRVMADSVIYHGPMGEAGYQSITNRMLPLRGLPKEFDTFRARCALAVLRLLQPAVRAWSRNGRLRVSRPCPPQPPVMDFCEEFSIRSPEGHGREHFLRILLDDGWTAGGPCDGWDLEKSGTRILMATEHGEGPGTRVLVRAFHGDVGEIRKRLAGAAD